MIKNNLLSITAKNQAYQRTKSGVSTNSTIPAFMTAEAVTYEKSTGVGAFYRGAKDGVRTRDLDLGKVALYQLSYFRVTSPPNYRRIVDAKLGNFCGLSSPDLKKVRKFSSASSSKLILNRLGMNQNNASFTSVSNTPVNTCPFRCTCTQMR